MRGALRTTVLIATLLAACGGEPPPEAEYPDLAAAIAAGAVGSGRIPAWLPPSARELRERRAIDTTELWVRFVFDPAELGTITARCEEIPALEAIHPRLNRTDRIPWWDPGLRVASAENRGRYRMFRCHRGDADVRKPWSYLAVEPAAGFGWYWELRH